MGLGHPGQEAGPAGQEKATPRCLMAPRAAPWGSRPGGSGWARQSGPSIDKKQKQIGGWCPPQAWSVHTQGRIFPVPVVFYK